MPNSTIAGLNGAAAPLTGAELLALWQSNATVNAPITSVAAFPAIFASGIDPTGENDSAPGLNNAIQNAISTRVPLVLPAGLFKINSPVYCYNGFGSSVNISGQGGFAHPTSTKIPEYPLTISDAMTVLYANFTDAPAVIFSGNRYSTFKKIAIIGQNLAPVTGTPQTWQQPVDVQADYVSAGCRSAQYSPYCGIAIDPCISPVAPPDGGYPGLAYNQSDNIGSTGIIFEEVNIQEFVVGIALSTSGTQGNGDDISFRSVNVTYCDTAYVCGDSQARLWRTESGSIFGCRQAYDCLNYGSGEGTNPVVTNPIYGYLYRLFAFNCPFSDAAILNGYAESIRTFGQFGTGFSTIRSAFKMDGGTYYITAGDVVAGVVFAPLPPLLLESHGPTKLENVSVGLTGSSSYLTALNITGEGGLDITLKTCTVPGTDLTDIPPFVGVVLNSGNGGQVTVDGVYVVGTNGFTLWKDTPQGFNIASFASGGRYRGHIQAQTVTDNVAGVPARYTYLPLGANGLPQSYIVSVSNIVVSGSTVSFTAGSHPEQILVGDTLFWQMIQQGYSADKYTVPGLKVTSVNTGTGAVVCSMLFDPIEYDTAANWNLSNPNTMYGCPVRWAPAQQLTCTTSTTSAVITSVSPTSCLKNGDYVTGAGIPAGTRVVSGASTASVTLSNTPTANASGVVLYFDRLVNPTTTPAY